MGVSADEVRWAYRLLLGREPESEEAISRHMATPDRVTMCRLFIGSAEFVGGETAARLIGRYMGVTATSVEVAADEEQIAAMLGGIAESWTRFGAEEPHWSVLTSPEYAPGEIEHNVDQFYASGEPGLDYVTAQMSRCGVDLARIRSALDFGCGVGRLTLALGRRVPHVTGVDISPGHIRVAQERALTTGAGNVGFRTIAGVEDVGRLPMFDLILCIIVLQHNPPPVIAALLGRLLGRLNPGGVATFQVPTFIDGYSFDVAGYLSGTKPRMEMNVLPQPAVFEVVHAAGCVPLEVREDTAAGGMNAISQTFLVRKL